MRIALAATSCLLASLALDAAPPVRPPIVSYTIRATLDVDSHTIRGSETIRWRNTSAEPVTFIPLHLYMNAFREGSTFEREGDVLRGVHSTDDGSITLQSVVIDGAAVMSTLRYLAPDDGNTKDRTLARVDLRSPLQPGATTTISIDFTVKLPPVSARAGYSEDFVMAGQWYPKPAVLEPAGTRGATEARWNLHQYHSDSEYYADFADYDVTLRTPADWIVGATGRRVASTDSGGMRVTRWVAKDVHDFAWTASPDFVESIYTFDPARDVPDSLKKETLALLGNAPSLRPVRVRLLMQEGNRSQTERYRAAVFATLAWCGLRFGAYPWGELTIVDPPPDASAGAGGMEYPMLVTGMSSPALGQWPLSVITRWPETVVVHEVAHQYWYGLVASNEFEESWIDEGLASWTEQQVMDWMFPGATLAGVMTPGLSTLAMQRAQWLQALEWDVDAIATPAWKFGPDGYALNSYPKAALAISQLEGIVGKRDFARAIHTFFQRWSFRHPGTSDFFKVIREVTGQDLANFESGLFRGTARFDHVISEVDVDEQDEGWKSRVAIARTGALQIPADVEFRFEDGSTRRARMPANARWAQFSVTTRSPLHSIVIDPEWVNVLETDRTNNVKVLGSSGVWAMNVRGAAMLAAARLIRFVVPGW